MSNYIDEHLIEEYVVEYNALATAIETLEYRQEQIDSILRNEHNFDISKDRL
jgi:hypothetical protein